MEIEFSSNRITILVPPHRKQVLYTFIPYNEPRAHKNNEDRPTEYLFIATDANTVTLSTLETHVHQSDEHRRTSLESNKTNPLGIKLRVKLTA